MKGWSGKKEMKQGDQRQLKFPVTPGQIRCPRRSVGYQIAGASISGLWWTALAGALPLCVYPGTNWHSWGRVRAPLGARSAAEVRAMGGRYGVGGIPRGAWHGYTRTKCRFWKSDSPLLAELAEQVLYLVWIFPSWIFVKLVHQMSVFFCDWKQQISFYLPVHQQVLFIKLVYQKLPQQKLIVKSLQSSF